jgi:hypothetical protein
MMPLERGRLYAIAHPNNPTLGRFLDEHTDATGFRWLRFTRIRVAAAGSETEPGPWAIPADKAADWIRPADLWTLGLLGYPSREIRSLLRVRRRKATASNGGKRT